MCVCVCVCVCECVPIVVADVLIFAPSLFLTSFTFSLGFDRLPQVAHKPGDGTLFVYDRDNVKFRKDGHSWQKRADGRHAREDHAKLKVMCLTRPERDRCCCHCLLLLTSRTLRLSLAKTHTHTHTHTLQVDGKIAIYSCYAHLEEDPNFHRRLDTLSLFPLHESPFEFTHSCCFVL